MVTMAQARMAPSVVLAMAVLVLGSVSAGCASTASDFQREFTPGQVSEDSKIHAFSAAGLSYGFLSIHMAEWDARLESVEDDVPAFVDALDKVGARFTVDVVARTIENADSTYEAHDVNLIVMVPAKDGKPTRRFVLPGQQGVRMTEYARALVPLSDATGVGAEVLRRGHFALFKLATMSTSLSASDDAMRRHAFGLLVLKHRLEQRVEHADFAAPLRTPEKSIEDVDLALRVVAKHHSDSSRLRAEVLAALAFVRAAESDRARELLVSEVHAMRTRAKAWQREHRRPEMDDFGVRVKTLKLPTPENMLAVLDKDGYLTAAVQVSKGLATGDASQTIEGLGKLAPENSSLRLAADGTAAALRGDVEKTADCVLALASKDETVGPLAKKLRSLKEEVSTTVDSARALEAKIPKSGKELSEAVRHEAETKARRELDRRVIERAKRERDELERSPGSGGPGKKR